MSWAKAKKCRDAEKSRRISIVCRILDLDFILSLDFFREISASPGSNSNNKSLSMPEDAVVLESVLLSGVIEVYTAI
jgi:hypothetical protein